MGKAIMLNGDPFCDVDLMNLSELPGKSVVRLRDAETGEMTPISTMGAIHGSDYQLIPNARLHQMTQDILERSGMKYSPLASGSTSKRSPFTWDGKKFASRWCLEGTATKFAEGTNDSTSLMLGVEALNSYDGSFKVGIRFFAMSIRCKNQFYSNNLLGGFTFRHYDKGENSLEGDISDAVGMLEQQASRFSQCLPKLNKLRDTQIGAGNTLKGFLDVHQKIRKSWPSSYDSLLLDELANNGVTRKEFHTEESQTAHTGNLWGLLNAYTAVCTHKIGGFNGAGLNQLITDEFVSMT